MTTILATGSGSGIGAAALRRLVKPGDKVMIHARQNATGVAAVADELRVLGAETATGLADLADPGEGAALVARTVETFGSLDTLIHAAGFPVRTSFGEATAVEFGAVMQAIAGSFLEMARAALPHVARSQVGRIVAVSTHNAHVFRHDYPVYPISGAAKSALETFVRALAIELAPSGATANAVVPGLIRKEHGRQFLSPQEWAELPRVVPIGRIGEADEVGAVIAFLASREASYVTGQVVHVNGGLI